MTCKIVNSQNLYDTILWGQLKFNRLWFYTEYRYIKKNGNIIFYFWDK